MPNASSSPARPTFSGKWVAGIVLAHLGLLAALASLDVMPLAAPPNALRVHIITPAAPAPAIVPPRPRPLERKPVLRPQPKPVARQPVLAVQSEAPSAAVEVAQVRETPPPPAPPVPAAPTVVSQPHFDADYLHNPAPAYPPLSRRMGEEGRVVLRVFVEPTGHPSQIEIKTGSGSPRLDQAAQDAVWRWKFVAAHRGFDAVGAWVLVPIVFNLRN